MIRKGRQRVDENAKGEDFCPNQTMVFNIELARVGISECDGKEEKTDVYSHV